MSDFINQISKDGFSMKLWRGERTCLIGFDVAEPEDDLVGFAIECKAPKSKSFEPLLNRLAFSYDKPATDAVTGARQFPSTEAPFQKFRWIHFPQDVVDGTYTYRATKIHMPKDGTLKSGTSLVSDISLDPVTYHDFLEVGFTRNFASSQAFLDKFPKVQKISDLNNKIIPVKADDGPTFKKMQGDIYDWLGFEAYALIKETLAEAVADKTKSISLDVFAYDLNEPDIIALFEKLGSRLRIIIDDSGTHLPPESAESKTAERLMKSAGAKNVKRTHFKNLQHHKVLIVKKNNKPIKVLGGSTNFSFRGLYIQANNALLFDHPDVAELYEQVFEAAFEGDPTKFSSNPLAAKWQTIQIDGKPPLQFCFSPHKDSNLSLTPVACAVEQATTSVLYAVAFLYQTKSGPTAKAFADLMKRPIFSYGASDKQGKLELKKPDGTVGLVDFNYLSAHAPEPFKTEWSGQAGINIHHKFVVTDFNLKSAKVFSGSSNLAPAGESGNGDHLVMIQDQKVATSYAIEAVRIFDHLHFRSNMADAKQAQAVKGEKAATQMLALRKPTAISGQPAWFKDFYKNGSQKQSDRKLFA